METNALYYGDNLDILRTYVESDSIDLVYLDPPFNSWVTAGLIAPGVSLGLGSPGRRGPAIAGNTPAANGAWMPGAVGSAVPMVEIAEPQPATSAAAIRIESHPAADDRGS